MKKVIAIMIAAAVAVALGACSRSKTDKQTAEAVEAASGLLTEALERGDAPAAAQMADSMALYVDDLSPDETVAVLLAFIKANDAAQGADLVTQRKYIDVYDIATGMNPRDMERAFDRARRLNPDIDFRAVAKDYRHNLAEYDALRTYGKPEPEEEQADSTAVVQTDSIPTPLAN